MLRQEIARFEVTVSRDGKPPISLTQVPRVEDGDILRGLLLKTQVILIEDFNKIRDPAEQAKGAKEQFRETDFKLKN